MQLPDELNDDLRQILGMVPWETGRIARAMRADGQDIACKMEVEQAVVLHKLLSIYAEHGADWRFHAAAWLQALMARLKTKAAVSKG